MKKPATGPNQPAPAVNLLMMAVILLISFFAYSNALSNGFVYDDVPTIQENYWIQDFKYIPEIFSSNVWAFYGRSGKYYRPMMHTIYTFNYHVFGPDPWGFHLVNILFHAASSILIFLIASVIVKEARPSASSSFLLSPFFAAILFATHPVHTEAVTWISGTPDVSFTAFYLLSLYLYIRSGARLGGAYALSLLSFFIATLCKEPALTLPLVLIAYDHVFREEKMPIAVRVMRYVPFLAVAGIYFAMRIHALGGFAPQTAHRELGLYDAVINVFPLLSGYLGKLLLPINLNVYHVLHPVTSILEKKAILSLVAVASFVMLTIIASKKNKALFFSLLLVIVPLLPALYIPWLGKNSFAERYLYLPSCGFVISLSLLIEWTKVKMPERIAGTTAFLAVLAGLYFAGTLMRNPAWRDEYTLWTDTVQKSPESAVAQSNLGLVLIERRQYDKAIEHIQIAEDLEPANPKFHNNLGVAYTETGATDKAIEQYEIALRLDPNNEKAHYGLGIVYSDRGQLDAALIHLQTASSLNPRDAGVQYYLGNVFLKKGLIDIAIEHFKAAATLNPSQKEFLDALAEAYDQKRSSHH